MYEEICLNLNAQASLKHKTLFQKNRRSCWNLKRNRMRKYYARTSRVGVILRDNSNHIVKFLVFLIQYLISRTTRQMFR